MNFLNPRNVALAVMVIAIGFALFTRQELPQDRTDVLKERQIRLAMKLFSADALLFPSEVPENLRKMVRDQLRDQVNHIDSQLQERQIFPIEKFILLRAIGDVPERPAFGREDLLREVDLLYFKGQTIPENSKLFKLGSGDLARLYQQEQISKENAESLRGELQYRARVVATLTNLIVLAGIVVCIAGVVVSFLFFRSIPPVRFFPVLQTIDGEQRRLLLEAAVLYVFIVFPVGVAFGKYASSIFPDKLSYVAVHLTLAFAASVMYYSRSAGVGVLRRLMFPENLDWMKEVGLGILGFAAIFPVAAGALYVITLASPGDAIRFAHPIVFELEQNPIKVFLLAALLVPVIEEVVFRVFLYGFFRKVQRVRFAAFFSAFILAILHPQGAIAVPYLIILGVGLALLREYRPSPIASMTTHACVNGFAVVMGWLLTQLL